MKLNISKMFGRLRFQSSVFLTGLMLSPLMALGANSIAIFTGNITAAPQVNATSFYNAGTWNITTTAPFTTANTLNYTNVGTMNGSLGWEFDWGPDIAGQRSMSASFFNDSRGAITAADGTILNPESVYNALASYLLISATNIVNKGTLAGGAAGEIVLAGVNVNLRRSVLAIANITARGSPGTTTNFSPDTAIYDEDWQQTNTFPNSTTPYAFDSSAIWNGSQVRSPVFYMNGLCLLANGAFQLGFIPSLADSTNIESAMYMTNIVYTNLTFQTITTNVPTKIFRQAVFVAVGDPNIIPDDRFFANSDNISNLFQTITVRLTSAMAGNSIYLEDTLGAWTNRGLALNLAGNTGNNPQSTCADPTFRPANYTLSRLDPGTFAPGILGLGPPATNFFYDSSFSNAVIQAAYAGYGGYVDDLVRHPEGAALTNLPGRIIINATNLDLTQTTLISDGAQIAVQANNFLGSTGAVVSCQNLSFNLGSAAGNVNVTNLVTHTSVPGMNGNVYAWSAEWTNGMITGLFTNSTQITNSDGSSTITNNVLTNIAEMDFHVLLVDATALSASVPVTVQDLILQTNTVISDSMNVVDTFLFNGQNLTLLGALNLSGPNLQNWSRTLTPYLLYFTNNGSLSIPQDAYFGSDGPTNYAAFVNHGAISVGGREMINSVFYQSSGQENAPGGYFVTTASGKIENAGITSGQDMDFTGGFLKLDNSTLSAGNQLNFNLTSALYDSGGSANNTLICGNGFNLPVKPATGDLLGTAITGDAYNGAEVDYLWAGQDHGATVAGYSNNVALGQLILSPQGVSSFPPLFYFSGASVSNALYVDLLDLSQITNLEEMLQTDPNLVIYYAAAKLPSAITVLSSNGIPQEEVETNNSLNGQSYYVIANGGSGQVPQEAEEVLNGKLGGHLRWVGSFAGPNSSVDVIVNGQTVSVNRALRYSLVIDSNGNGIPNGLDPNPFNTLPVVLAGSLVQTPPPAKKFAITWLAQTNLPYQVQYATSLPGTNWQPLLNYTNTGSTNATVTVWDTNAVSSQRFYRVSHP